VASSTANRIHEYSRRAARQGSYSQNKPRSKRGYFDISHASCHSLALIKNKRCPLRLNHLREKFDMKRSTMILMVGILLGSLFAHATLRAQESEVAKAPKVTLKSLEAQILRLQPNFAVVNTDGTLARGSSSVVKTTRTQTGLYQVTFNRDVSTCAYTAVTGNVNANLYTLGIVYVAEGSDSKSVSVLAASSIDPPFLGTPTLHDLAFTVTVTCE
jgi:hypothetical protein